MLRLYHLKITPTIAIFLLLWGCSGGGGGGAGGGDQRVTSTSIKLPASGSFRQLNTSDLFIYDAEVSLKNTTATAHESRSHHSALLLTPTTTKQIMETASLATDLSNFMFGLLVLETACAQK